MSARSLTIPEDGCSTSSTGASATVGSEQLTVFQKKMLINNWAHLTKTGTGGISNVMFQKFMSKRPETRKMFTKAAVVSGFSGEGTNLLQEHVRLLTELIDKAIAGIDDLAETGKLCVSIGNSHVALNGGDFNAEVWDKFGQTMLESVTQLEVVRKHKELVRAWMILISFLIDKIRQGFATGLRRLKFQQARPATCKEEPTAFPEANYISRSSQNITDDSI